MKHRPQASLLAGLAQALVASGALFAAGCESTIAGTEPLGAGGTSPAGSSGSSGAGSGAGGGGGVSGSAASAGTGSDCVGSDVTTPKRVVRLLDRQLVNSYIALFGSEAVTTIAQGLVLESLI